MSYFYTYLGVGSSRAKKGERLLVTCAPIVSSYVMENLAQALYGPFLTNPDGRYFQVVAVRIDERTRKGERQREETRERVARHRKKKKQQAKRNASSQEGVHPRVMR